MTPPDGMEGVIAPALTEAFGEWLFRMHGTVSSCDHATEGEALAKVAADALRAAGFGLVSEAKAEALREAADDMEAIFRSGHLLGATSDNWLRARANEATR